ncbi:MULTISPECIES: ATP-binding protein [unclassified Streptomyces]|uniref:ATP-binding protein n=1 Tax=unclassified Streptomyces TaxID=2593676 RepID=UPI002DDACA6C|nr:MULTISPECIES: ATP-binding protein [unclassified Streptomyces]WSA91991.1 ATP-binding protein [Streptomyces sp. NBC_01795]WSS15367.1 ATP-binding protein [Streptomyces sp. NBC_01186]WSS44212.1 ATP-binding protein [Streptomyces sp. NBC_01187]
MYAAPARRDPVPAAPALDGSAACQDWQLSFPARKGHVARVRALFTRWLEGRREPTVPLSVAESAVLLLSELAANAVVHADCPTGSGLVCRAALAPATGPGASGGGLLRIEVHDQAEGERVPRPRYGDAEEESGRGLCIVAALAGEWGVRRSPLTRGNAVWATLPLPVEFSQ